MARLALDLTDKRVLPVPRLHVRAVTTVFLYLILVDLSLYGGTDPDYWWHLRTGQIIVQDHGIPRYDPFSLTMAGSRWIAHEWLSETVIYSVNTVFGYVGTALIFGIIGASSLVVIHRLALRLGVAGRPALLLVALAGLTSAPYWTVRPQVITFLFTAIFLRAVFLRYTEGRGHLWYLPLLMIVWANLHGGFVMGLVVVSALIASLLIDRLLLRRPVRLGEPILILVSCVGAVIINPNGLDLLVYPATYLLPGDASRSLISEWQAPNFHLVLHWPLMVGLALLVITGVSRRQGVLPVVLALLFVAMALEASRNQPLFALALPILAGQRWMNGRVPDTTAEESTGGGAARANWLILAAIVSLFAVVLLPQTTAIQAGRDAPLNGYPQDAARYVLNRYPDARVFNSYNYGGYLIYVWYPEQRVFVDGRADMYGSGLLADYSKVTGLREGWEAVLDRYAIDVVLIKGDSPLASALRVDPLWQEDFRGTRASVFVRSSSGQVEP